MERERLQVTRRVEAWGSVYIIGGTAADGEILPADQAGDLIARFDHEQTLFCCRIGATTGTKSTCASPSRIGEASTVRQQSPTETRPIEMLGLAKSRSIMHLLGSISIFQSLRKASGKSYLQVHSSASPAGDDRLRSMSIAGL